MLHPLNVFLGVIPAKTESTVTQPNADSVS